jgi:hypothetical protein
MSAEALRATVRQLDDLGHHLERLSADRNRSAHQWMIASTPFRMQVPRARKRLAELAGVSVIAQERDSGWTLELTNARLLVERQLDDLAMCLHVLHRLDGDAAHRFRETEAFAFQRTRFLKSIGRLRYLIVQRFPKAQQGGNGHLNNHRLRTVREQCNGTKPDQ